MKEELQNMLGNYVKELEEELYIAERTITLKQQKIDKAIEYIKKFIPKDIDTIILSERQRDYLLEILGDKEQEEYRLTKDENGTTQINGEWYKVEKIK